MLTAYVDAALKHAALEWMDEDHQWYAEIRETPGVWATADDRESCLQELRSVLENWILLSVYDHDELPAIDGIKLTVQKVA